MKATWLKHREQKMATPTPRWPKIEPPKKKVRLGKISRDREEEIRNLIENKTSNAATCI